MVCRAAVLAVPRPGYRLPRLLFGARHAHHLGGGSGRRGLQVLRCVAPAPRHGSDFLCLCGLLCLRVLPGAAWRGRHPRALGGSPGGGGGRGHARRRPRRRRGCQAAPVAEPLGAGRAGGLPRRVGRPHAGRDDLPALLHAGAARLLGLPRRFFRALGDSGPGRESFGRPADQRAVHLRRERGQFPPLRGLGARERPAREAGPGARARARRRRGRLS
mmetsp:Transcript_121102/g.302207  ORF Transcript_121102/g.302207 Transcript_121102/m.302207 type:complete len:217 (+) Transcript_121102:58-708(+)